VLLSITPSAHGKPSRQPQPALRGPKQGSERARGTWVSTRIAEDGLVLLSQKAAVSGI